MFSFIENMLLSCESAMISVPQTSSSSGGGGFSSGGGGGGGSW